MPVPLTLITGPANAAKIGAVLERLRAARPRDPLLVVPTAADVAHYQRELASSNIVFGARGAHLLAPDPRDRAPHQAARAAARLDRPRPRRPRRDRRRAAARARRVRRHARLRRRGRAAVRRARARPRRAGALHRGAAHLGRRRRRARRTPASSARSTRPTAARWRSSAARRSRATPGRRSTRCAPTRRVWARRPVFLYGFDDLTPTERDAVETLSGHAEADVCLALPVRAGPRRVRRPRGDRRGAAPARRRGRRTCRSAPSTTPRAPAARCTTSSASCSSRRPTGAPPNGAVRLLEAGGERAEAELVGAEVLELMRQGIAAPDIAVLLRGDAGVTALFAQVLAGYGIPVSHDRRVPLGRTRLGAGVLAGARAALDRGTRRRPADLAAHARAAARPERRRPAGGARPPRRDRAARGSPARCGRRGSGSPSSTALDRLAAAAAEGAEALLAALEAEAQAIWTAPHRRRAEVLGPEDLRRRPRGRATCAPPLRAARARRGRSRRCSGAPRDVLDGLAPVRVREPSALSGERARRAARRPARDPRAALPRGLRLRAAGRRVPAPPRARAVPVRRRPPRARRRHRPAAAAARGRARPRALALLRRRLAPRGRALPLLALVGRGGQPGRAVRLRRRRARAVRRRALGAARHAAARRRHLDAARRADAARAAPRLRRGAQRAGSRRRSARPGPRRCCALLAARDTEPARGLEAFAACGVRWLVEQFLRPDRIEPDPEPMQRGSLAHAVLERTLGAAARAHRLGRDRARAARRRARGAARRARRAHRRPRPRARRRALLRGLEADLERYLRTEAEHGAGYEPAALEWSFGRPEDAARAAPARRGRRRGDRPRRPDRRAARAAPRSCATTRAAPRSAARSGRTTCSSRWRSTCSPCASCSGREPVAGLYQPLAGRKLAARGLVRDDVPGDYVAHRHGRRRRRSTTRSRPPRALAARTAAELHAGRIRAVPRALLEPRLPATPRSAARASRATSRRHEAHARAARRDRRPRRVVAAGGGRRLRQDRGDGRALRRGGAARTASRSARS